MPYPPPPRTPSGPRRRTLLASAAGAAVLAGCTAGTDSEDGGAPSAATRARAHAARDSAELLERYDAVLAAHPELAQRLRPLRTAVAAHVAAFGGGTAGTATKPPSSKVSPTAAATASPSPTVPPRPKDALLSLADAERGVADRRARDLLEVPGELARLLASVSAAGAAHAYLLMEGAK
ncbi:hypothetical protein [Streptomyces sp. NK08204]|uniref:hypothetical protein n=1 Tax=Streptomyces sp. NK08204 TaxID=2873260 RepID=UPI001CED6346|nr:hypothetical protein [Streptomyces sp. NK08204]